MAKSIPQLRADAKTAGWSKWIRPGDADERAMLGGCWFDVSAGEHAVRFFEEWLYHTMGRFAGQRFTLLPWQRDDVLMPLFGWKRADGMRRFGKGDVFVAKKQGKSTVAAGLANYFLMTGGERAEVYGVAHTRDQAAIIYREAAAMARKSPELAKRLKPRDSQKRIIFPASQSFYQALAGEACSRGVEGINPLLLLFDEIHVQRSRELYDALTYASAARPNSLMLSVSTVGVADPTTIWWEQYEYAKGVIDGSFHDNARFAYIAQADEEVKESKELRADPAQWAKAMPSLGVTVTEDKVRDAVREAENSPKKLNNLIRYLFNVPTAQVEKVVPLELWDAGLVDDEPDLENRWCYGGLDLASSEDLTAFVLYWPATDEWRPFVKCWIWCPEDKIVDRTRRQMAHYENWVKAGWLLETGGNRIDHSVIEAQIRECFDTYKLREVGFDAWNADAVVNPLIADGHQMVSVQQTLTGMSSGTKGVLDELGEITHMGNPVLRWCLGNCAAEEREDAIRFSKKRSPEKIDAAVALAIAKGRALAGTEEHEPYNDRGIISI